MGFLNDFIDWLENHEAAVSSLVCCAGGFLALGWSTVNPGLNPSRFYSAGVTGLFGVGAIALSIKGLKEEERSIIKRDTHDEIFSIYQAAEVQTVQGALFPPPPMPSPPGVMSNYYQMEFNQLSEQLDFYNWENLADEASGILVGGNSGSAKTSLAAGFIVGKLTAVTPAEVIVLDIHQRKNIIWKQMGFPRVESDVETIFQIMKWLIDEIERRKQEDGHPMIICLDEINDTLSELEQLDIVKPLGGKEKRRNTFIYAIRKLSNARKFDICLLGFMQSHNTEAIGIDGKFRNNFLLVLCGASARGEIQNIWKHDDPRFLHIKNTAYPVVISGSNPHQIAEHPTHKHHTQYRKKGNAPANLIQPRFLDKSSIPVYESREQSEDFEEDYQPRQTSKPEPQLAKFNFQKAPEPPKAKPIINGVELQPEWLDILELAKQNGSISTRDACRSAMGQRLKLNAITARYIFEKLQDAKLGTVAENNGSCTFTLS
uniref:ATPase (Modular protein) n=2 Tax=Planktothrix pseudagardhii TaxID=132604 RepID=A0A9W4CTN2_9CYAN|nr:ATPase (Modular protein) [Planktothrix pseudagardhii]